MPTSLADLHEAAFVTSDTIREAPAAYPAESPARPSALPRVVAAGLAWLGAGALAYFLPEQGDWPYTAAFAALLAVVGAVLILGGVAGRAWPDLEARLRASSPRFVATAALLTAWQLVTAKYEILPMPFFPPPQAILEVFLDDWPKLGESIWHSGWLLAGGYLLGAAAGFLTGVSIGWSRAAAYWVHPVLRFVGPLPATAWLPIAFFVFPSSWSASTFLVALATGFPVAVLTWSGVASVNSAYYDIARTLGARPRFLILRVAVPAAMPHVFVGLFMGLGASFAVLVVAEMLGVKAGLGWYLQWAQGWAAYANMYAALIVMALAASGLITLLFRLRDRLLAWQKGLVRW